MSHWLAHPAVMAALHVNPKHPYPGPRDHPSTNQPINMMAACFVMVVHRVAKLMPSSRAVDITQAESHVS